MRTILPDFLSLPINADQFDFNAFDRVFNGFESLLGTSDHDNPKSIRPLLEKLLDIKAMQSYLAWYLQHTDIFDIPTPTPLEIDDYLPNGIEDISSAYFFTAQARLSKKTRQKGEYPLTEREFKEARQRIINAPRLFQTAEIFEHFIRNYLSALSEYSHFAYGNNAAGKMYGENTLREHIDDFLFSLKNGIDTQTIINEFLFAIALETKGNNIPPSTLVRIFSQPDIFTSVNYGFDDGGEIITCPFKQTIGHLLNSHYEYQPDGSYLLTQHPVRNGFFITIAQKLDKNNQELDPSHLPT